MKSGEHLVIVRELEEWILTIDFYMKGKVLKCSL